MQIIQGIRDKGAAIVIVVIALSLIGFILMDAKPSSGSFFGSNSSSIGRVNKQDIDRADFEKRVKMVEMQEEQQTGVKPGVEKSAEIRDQVWNQVVAEKVFYGEADKLGINFTSKELSAVLSSDDPSNPLTQDKNMIDPATGKLDPAKLREAFTRIKKMKGEEREYVDAQIIEPQKLTSISQKYFALLNASAYYPAWMEQRDIKDSKTFATLSYVNIGYGVISDSSIKVTDADVEAYVKAHKDLFKQEEGRTISYVAFSQLPNGADSVQTRQSVEALKSQFATETNTASFIARNTSAIEFDSNYKFKSSIPTSMADTIVKLPVGEVYGPYIDNKNYVLAKLLGIKNTQDSAKARHILIATGDPQTGQRLLEDSTAKNRADSILMAIRGGANFAQLAAVYGSDGTKDKGGDLGTFAYGTMVPEFNDFSFNKPVGTLDVVKTAFGYHVVEVQEQKGSSPKYKVALLAKEIIPSQATITNAGIEANKLSAEKNRKDFDAYIAKAGLQKVTLPNIIKQNDYRVGNLQDARQLVRWVFEAKKGAVSEYFNIDDKFIVATVDNVYKEGTQDVATARPMAEPAIRDEKKAAEIMKKLTATPTLESAAAAYNRPVEVTGQDSSITFTTKIINAIGDEPKLVGAAFSKDAQTKVISIAGKRGVYVFKVTGTGSKAADTPDVVAAKRVEKTNELRSQSAMNWFEGLKKQATIKDKRSDFF